MIKVCKKNELEYTDWCHLIRDLCMDSVLADASNVIVKPNFAAGSYVEPKSHVVTDITFLSEFVRFVLKYNSGCDVYIAESDSTGYGFAYLKFKHLGLPNSLKLTQEEMARVHLLDLSRDRLVKVDSDSFKYFDHSENQLWLSEILMNANIIVSMSNLKTHSVTGYTGACKNLFGCLPASEKCFYHPWIHKVVHDLAIAIKPTINIVDAFYGMELNGPVQGIKVNSGYRVFSNSALEADMCAATLAGVNWRRVQYLKYLAKTLQNEPNDLLKQYHVGEKIYLKPSSFLRAMNFIGLLIQKIGYYIEMVGHRIHACNTPINLMVMLARPLLVKVFGIERLKSWKGKIMK